MSLPQDSMMMLSVLNTKLRDFYKNLDELCEDLNVNKAEILDKMAEIDYVYNPELNKFI